MWIPFRTFSLLASFLVLTHSVRLADPQTSPPLPEGQCPPVRSTRAPLLGAVHAVVVKSWNNGGASAWGQLNAEWPQHGSIPIELDTSSLGGSDFSYESLAATGADVVILSDPAGGLKQYSAAEVEALRCYAEEGHNVIATYHTLRWGDVDNRALAPIFGLRADLLYISQDSPGISNAFHVLARSPLTNGLVLRGPAVRLPNRWQSTGFPRSEVPADDQRWDPVDLAGARAVAQCDAGRGIVTVYKAPTYVGIYVSNMPEFFGGFLDKRFLYNAIVHPRP